MNLKNIHNIYFIGIGGIGMSALARYFHVHNFYVCGYDKTETTITKSLEELGILIHYRDDIDLIPYIGIENGAAAAEVLNVHYQAISRNVFE